MRDTKYTSMTKTSLEVRQRVACPFLCRLQLDCRYLSPEMEQLVSRQYSE